MDGIFSTKSDVFSFGVLLLEIISGKRNKGFYNSDHDLNLLGCVSSKTSYYPILLRSQTLKTNLKGIQSLCATGVEELEKRERTRHRRSSHLRFFTINVPST